MIAPLYIPLLKALPSELKALALLDETVIENICPLLDIPKFSSDPEEVNKQFKASENIIQDQIFDVCEKISAICKGKSIFVDNYRWFADSVIESGELVISYITNTLLSMSVNVIPTIGFDRWENESYKDFFKLMHYPKAPYYCIRIDSVSLEESEDTHYFISILDSILIELSIKPSQCVIILDGGSVVSKKIEWLYSSYERIIKLLQPYGFKNLISSACSMPNTIDKAVERDSEQLLIRKEMILWQHLLIKFPTINIVYSDYGIRSMDSAENNKAYGNTNAKIRYTTDRGFYIARGHMVKGDKLKKEKQNWGLAKKIVESPYYMDSDFSYGDYKILECSEKKINGNAGDWIIYDTTHHITYCVMEVNEFIEGLNDIRMQRLE